MARKTELSKALEREWEVWVRQRAYRLRLGDDLTASRPVAHVLYFRWGIHARRAVRAITQTRGARLSRIDGHPRWILEALSDEDLQDDTVRHSLTYMLVTARVHHGTYDGFGAPVVPSSPNRT